MNCVKLIAMSYGLLAIALSFTVGSLGTVMQASMSLTGSLNGPLMGLFTLGMLFPFVNSKVDKFPVRSTKSLTSDLAGCNDRLPSRPCGQYVHLDGLNHHSPATHLPAHQL